MGHGRQPRRVGLHQQSVERTHRRRLTDLRGTLEGDDAAERQIRPEVETAAGLVRTAGEAVDDCSFRDTDLIEHGEGLGPGRPGVHDECEIMGLGQLDLCSEHLGLDVARGMFVVEIEATLPHSHHLGFRQQGLDAPHATRGLVGVHPHRRPDALVGTGDGDPLHRGGEVAAHGDAALDTCGACRAEQLDHRRRRFVGTIEVTVIVDPAQHHGPTRALSYEGTADHP